MQVSLHLHHCHQRGWVHPHLIAMTRHLATASSTVSQAVQFDPVNELGTTALLAAIQPLSLTCHVEFSRSPTLLSTEAQGDSGESVVMTDGSHEFGSAWQTIRASAWQRKTLGWQEPLKHHRLPTHEQVSQVEFCRPTPTRPPTQQRIESSPEK